MKDLEYKIEEYLRGELSKEEEAIFEEKIIADKELAKRVAFKREISDFFKHRNTELEEKLSVLGNEFFTDSKKIVHQKDNYTKYIITAILICLITVGSIYLLRNQQKTTEVSEEVEVLEKIEKTDNINSEKTIHIPATEEENEENSIKNNLNEIDLELTIPKPKKDSQQIFADASMYLENENLELLINENIRSNDFDFKIIKQFEQTITSKNGMANLSFTGSLNKNKITKLCIYNNDKNSFNKDLKVLETTIVPEKNNKQYLIKFNANIPLEKGLYYYILHLDKTTEIIHISKFEVY